MSNSELIMELRKLTMAGMKDCKDALEESNFDLQKAVDIIKIKGQNIVSGRDTTASEGRVVVYKPQLFLTLEGDTFKPREMAVMVEVNCQTDFCANSVEFKNFCDIAVSNIADSAVKNNTLKSPESLEEMTKELISKTKENIVINRRWAEEAFEPGAKVFSYTHTNNKIGVVLTLMSSSIDAVRSPEFTTLGEDLAMQVAAMNPLAISSEKISPAEKSRQQTIFETQLLEAGKPQKVWPKIIEGKFNKWYSDVCLLNQESIIVPKTTVQQVVDSVAKKLNTEITVVNFIRCRVGETTENKRI